ncbi:MAG: hypothetical protein JXA28_06905 [Bacteroidetes bacterium]|nr:hypothetical protein [Bacteroidota bacterium]
MQLASNRVLFGVARVVEIIVAAVFLLAVILKALDPVSFAEQIAEYGIFPDLSLLAAWTLIIVESLLAIALIVNFLPRIVPLLTIALLLFFIGITIYGMSIGLGENCGCFGNLVHRGPEQVIIEDVLMIAALFFVVVVLWHHQSESNFLRIATVIGTGMAVAALTAFGPYLPADDLVTQLHPGAQFSDWPVDGLFGKNLNEGTHLVFLFTVDTDDIGSQVQRMNALAQSAEGLSAVGMIIDGTEHLTTLMFEYAAAFPVGAVEPRFARPLYRTLPRVFILHEGTVTHTWSELPRESDVVKAIQSLQQHQDAS